MNSNSIEFYIQFNNRKIKIKIKIKNKNKNKNKPELGFDELKKVIKKKIELNLERDILLTYKENLLTPKNCKEILNNNIIIDVNIKLKGGIPFIGELLSAALYDPFMGIINAIVKMTFLLGEIFTLFINLVKLAINIFDPSKVIDDVMYASTSGVGHVFKAFLEKIDFGQSEPDNKGDGGPFGVTEKKRAICIPPSFVNLLILVLCPPLALFMFKGIGGWFGVIICSLLTYYLYYFPGFIYAALHILC